MAAPEHPQTMASGGGVASPSYSWRDLPHLAKRIVWSLRKPTPDAQGEAWLLGLLTPGEALLYRTLCPIDRAHAINSARAVEHLGAEVAIASALHDVGKVEAGLGTPGRVLASLAALVMYDRARGWHAASGLAGQIGRYLDHPERGARALEAAGASALAVTWAREHHLSSAEQSIDNGLAEALLAADE